MKPVDRSSTRLPVLALALVLPALFVSDILYGLMVQLALDFPVSPGTLLRGAVLACALYFFIVDGRYAGKGLQLIGLLLILLVLPGIILGLLTPEFRGHELRAASKVLYFPMVSIMFVIWMRKWSITTDMLLRNVEYSAYVLGLALLISQQLGLNQQTYGDYAFGNLGVFFAQNDMTLAFGLALLAATYRLVNVRFSWFRLALLVLSGYACLQIGTRASLAIVIGAAVVPVASLIWERQAGTGEKGRLVGKRTLISMGLVLVMGLLLANAVHEQLQHGYQKAKLNQLLEGSHPRSQLLKPAMAHIQERLALYDHIGEGMSGFHHGVARHFDPSLKFRWVEVDWMDLFGAYGWPFTLLLHLLLVWVVVDSARRFIFQGAGYQGLIAAAGLLYAGHGALAGHALVSPIPSTLMAAYMAMYAVLVLKWTRE